MAERFPLNRFYSTDRNKTATPRKEQVSRHIADKDRLIAERKRHLIEVIKELIVSENIQNPAEQLTLKVLQGWMDNNADKFLGLKSVNSMIRTYFLGEMTNLKFSLGLIKE